MTKIIFIAHDGKRTEVDAVNGRSVMETAVAHDIAGIVGECGGSAMCATCHVYVEPAYQGRLPAMRPEEDAMLESTMSDRKENSRLSCQIKISDDLDGAIFNLPERQV